MTKHLSRIYSLDEIDLVDIVTKSFPGIKNNLNYPENVVNDQKKIRHIIATVTNFVDKFKDEIFMFKREFNGKLISLSVGRKLESSFLYSFLFTDTMSNSRSWTYKLDVVADQTKFLIQNQIDRVLLLTLKDSSTRNYAITRYSERPDLFYPIEEISNDGMNITDQVRFRV